MRNTIHINGMAEDIDICERLSDNYDLEVSFDYDDESEAVLPNIFIRFYSSVEKMSPEEIIECRLRQEFGDMTLVGQETGYSEFTIDGFCVSSSHLGGHNLQKIIDSFKGKYLHILIDQVKK